jgi:membrane fusion protein (multidrug efflux system)
MDVATRNVEEVEAEGASWTRRLLMWGVPILVVAAGVYFYGSAGRYVSTDNAYLQQDRVDVAPQVSGNVVEVLVGENARVVADTPLLRLDDSLQRIAVAAAESRLGAARTEVAATQASYREKLGEVDVARRVAEFSDRDLGRQQELAQRKLVAASAVDTADRSATLSRGAIGVLQLQLAQITAKLGGKADDPIDSYPSVRTAIADLDRARVDLDRTLIKAPQSGVVSHLPKVGARVEVGRAACAIVADGSIWVEANFKETDLEWVRPGQPVQIDVDTYHQHRWSGRVESIAQATGAEFALLPAQNATGNWVKVVQRIPVRIAIVHRPDDPPLRDGMSANVEIDTGPHTRFDRWFGRAH